MKQDTLDKITQARISLILNHPFFGNLATRLKVQEGGEWCNTAATDGRNLYFSEKFVESLNAGELQFVIAHEVLHCVLDHLGRIKKRDLQLSNIAQDFAVNQLLVDEKIGVKPKLPLCQDNKYRNMFWEEIYDQLCKNAKKINISQLGQLLDQHLEQKDGDSSEGDKNGKGKISGNSLPSLSKEELEKIREELKEAVLTASQVSAGNTPAGIQRIIDQLTKPRINWRDLLRQSIQSLVKNDYSWMKINRKNWHNTAILPGLKEDETIDIAVAVDMSGSIGPEDASTFLAEIRGIMQQYSDFKVNVWCFDTQIYGHKEFNQYNSDEINDYVCKGGGGTDYVCNFDHMKNNDIKPNIFIMMTDGYPCGSWGDDKYCDTIFLIKGNKTATAPFGQTIIFENF